jgi:hypothetical protein
MIVNLSILLPSFCFPASNFLLSILSSEEKLPVSITSNDKRVTSQRLKINVVKKAFSDEEAREVTSLP